MLDNRIENEAQFHNQIFVSSVRKNKVSKIYAIDKSSRKYYFDTLLSNCPGKKVLSYGCGIEPTSFLLANNNASFVHGIDISDKAVEINKEKITSELKTKIAFSVMNAEDMSFRDNTFDMICGSGILHHLDLKKSLSEISRVLKIDGRAIFLEPLGHNPLINLYRKLTPAIRTADEHPLKVKDLKLINKYFRNVNIKYFYLFSLMAVPLRKMRSFERILFAFNTFDQWLFKAVPFLKRFAWIAIIDMSK